MEAAGSFSPHAIVRQHTTDPSPTLCDGNADADAGAAAFIGATALAAAVGGATILAAAGAAAFVGATALAATVGGAAAGADDFACC